MSDMKFIVKGYFNLTNIGNGTAIKVKINDIEDTYPKLNFTSKIIIDKNETCDDIKILFDGKTCDDFWQFYNREKINLGLPPLNTTYQTKIDFENINGRKYSQNISLKITPWEIVIDLPVC